MSLIEIFKKDYQNQNLYQIINKTWIVADDLTVDLFANYCEPMDAP